MASLFSLSLGEGDPAEGHAGRTSIILAPSNENWSQGNAPQLQVYMSTKGAIKYQSRSNRSQSLGVVIGTSIV